MFAGRMASIACEDYRVNKQLSGDKQSAIQWRDLYPFQANTGILWYNFLPVICHRKARFRSLD